MERAPKWLAIVDERADLESLRADARACRACPLWQDNTGTVFGEGPDDAALVLVGEQPGDHEDRQQRPFVGPAGRVLDALLVEAGIDRGAVYLTNAVKHFAHERKGARRLHRRPTAAEIEACRPWLRGEQRNLKPRVLVLLGAVATASELGSGVLLTAVRGAVLTTDTHLVLPTWHPSAVLRARAWDADGAARLRDELRADLQAAADVARAIGHPGR